MPSKHLGANEKPIRTEPTHRCVYVCSGNKEFGYGNFSFRVGWVVEDWRGGLHCYEKYFISLDEAFPFLLELTQKYNLYEVSVEPKDYIEMISRTGTEALLHLAEHLTHAQQMQLLEEIKKVHIEQGHKVLDSEGVYKAAQNLGLLKPPPLPQDDPE